MIQKRTFISLLFLTNIFVLQKNIQEYKLLLSFRILESLHDFYLDPVTNLTPSTPLDTTKQSNLTLTTWLNTHTKLG